jgi:hypothetical protein
MLRKRIHTRPLWPAAIVVVALVLVAAMVTTLHWPSSQQVMQARSRVYLFAHRYTVADLLAHPPASGKSVEVDAYFSGAYKGLTEAPAPAAGVIDWRLILSDEPFLPELALLGGTQVNSLTADAPWLVVAAPAASSTVAPQLPYFARLRGHLADPATTEPATEAGRVFVVERVELIHAQEPPAAPAAGDYTSWSRYQSLGATYSVPQPPGWKVDAADPQSLTLRDPLAPDSPVTIIVHPGETHHDPYDPDALPPLLAGHKWTVIAQNATLDQGSTRGQGLVGYRLERIEQSGTRTTTVLLSANGDTYEFSVAYPLGTAAPQPVLSAYSAIVAGFRLERPVEPSPTPPVRQVLGAGPFLSEDETLVAACDLLGGDIASPVAQLMTEAAARQLGTECARFNGHYDGIWVVTVRTTRAARTGVLRLLLDATNGRELCRQEIEEAGAPTPTPLPDMQPLELVNGRPAQMTGPNERWIEVILSQQVTIAWEGNTVVRRMICSTGVAAYPTVTGTFRIQRKIISAPMVGPGYNLPGVPHIQNFYEGYALHGAYWHTNWGSPMSHGCVNLSLSDAAWLFDWTSPKLPAEASWVNASPCDPGTLVVVRY